MSTDTVSPLRQRMMDDMSARKLGAHSQRSHISSCKRFAAFLKRSPDTATPDDVRRFQLHLAETGMSICNRNRIMTGVKFLFRVTLRRPDLAAEIYHLREPQKIPQVMSPDETKRLPAVYGCDLRAGEVVRLLLPPLFCGVFYHRVGLEFDICKPPVNLLDPADILVVDDVPGTGIDLDGTAWAFPLHALHRRDHCVTVGLAACLLQRLEDQMHRVVGADC